MAKKKLTKRQKEIMDAILAWDFKEQFIDNNSVDASEWQVMRVAVPPVDEKVFRNLYKVLESDWKIAKELVVAETLDKFVVFNVSILVADWKKLYIPEAK